MATDLASLRLHVRIDEGRGPVLVLLHGINANADDLRPLIDHLGSGHRIIAPDLLGFGGSPKPPDIDYSTDDHVQVLAATLADLGVSERFVLVGYSLGGVIAVRYGATHPDRLRRLFLMSAPFYLPPQAYSRRGFDVEYAQAMLFQWLWKVIGRQKERNTPVWELASGRLRGVAEEYLRAGDLSQHWDVMARTLENTISRATFIEDLPRLTMPTVFALGVRDPIVRPDQTQALKRIKPDLEVRRIKGLAADHDTIGSTPERVAAEILRDEVDTLAIGLRTGSGEPLVLLPGVQGTWRDWEDAAGELAADHDVVALDLLGFGDSPAPLSSHYTLEDHAAAVLATASKAFDGAPFVVVGCGLGGTVALACAASDPSAVRRVVAISPLMPDPGLASDDPALARALASRDTLLATARDERMQRIASEKLEQRILPAVRSISAVLATSGRDLVARLRTPVRLVVPGAPDAIPAWLAALADEQPDRVRVDSTPGAEDPERSAGLVAAAVRGQELPAVAAGAGARSVAARALRDPVSAMLGGLNARLLTGGVLQLLVGLPLLLLPVAIPIELVTTLLGAWLGVEAVATLIGAFGLRRRGLPWLMWLLIGVVEVVFAAGVLVGGWRALGMLALIIIAGAALRGIVVLLVAWRASDTPGRRWVLVLEGVWSLAIAISLWTYPPLGSRLLRYAIGTYLTVSGLSGVALAIRNQRAARRRVRAYLAGD